MGGSSTRALVVAALDRALPSRTALVLVAPLLVRFFEDARLF